jgi:hypothetical protein
LQLIDFIRLSVVIHAPTPIVIDRRNAAGVQQKFSMQCAKTSAYPNTVRLDHCAGLAQPAIGIMADA